METPVPQPQKTRIAPVDCFVQGWELIKDRYWLFFGITVVGMLIGSAVPLAILLGPMMCGIYWSFLQKERGNPIEFGSLFKGMDFFLPSLIASLIVVGTICVIFLPVYIVTIFKFIEIAVENAHSFPPDYGAFVGPFSLLLVDMLIANLISMLFMFAYPLITEWNIKGHTAIWISLQAVLKNFWGLFGLLLLTMLAGFGGLLCCIVGTYFILPITFAALFVAYRKVFPDTGTHVPPPIPGNW